MVELRHGVSGYETNSYFLSHGFGSNVLNSADMWENQ